MTLRAGTNKRFIKRIVLICHRGQKNYISISQLRRRTLEKSIKIVVNSIKRTI